MMLSGGFDRENQPAVGMSHYRYQISWPPPQNCWWPLDITSNSLMVVTCLSFRTPRCFPLPMRVCILCGFSAQCSAWVSDNMQLCSFVSQTSHRGEAAALLVE